MATPEELTFSQLLYGGIGFMLLAGGTLLVFLVTYQRRLLEQQLHARAAETQHQQQLLTAIIEAQEGERERIGQDLHDGIGSTLATAKLLVSRLGSVPSAESPALLVTHIEQLMAAAVQDVRGISHSLYPVVLARFGLAEALQHLVDVCNEANLLPVSFEVHYTRPLALAQELALYRICQELITNALKHARGASWLRVGLRQQGDTLTLTVADDGCGFLLAAGPADHVAPVTQGAGLRSIAVRVQMLQAHLQRQSVVGEGTRTTIELRASTSP
jgi:two-component system NarL family sensor kinase